ncbi:MULTISPECIES: hypothetical protein [unclassified Parafrankia]|uniref:hypothetical protein n=1 Tax=unclassified Parafrankia TaxID=2994368 RepID=UPI000DA574D2|nr:MULTISPECIES: hypothetical protein [unclassified Parafrankia]TCJ32233.1 hypothetical protein E0504_44085 [Parafrankia sp. BMG5.11]CAI7979619.1 conserved hypothetical protein [Frankia sp. Hr75.2]SQD93814.1 conserved hypothetical protein [Parafrankia sp. Ea1.12]
MPFSPANTKWSVAAFDDNGAIGSFHPTPWEFHQEAMNAGTLWVGGYTAIPEVSNGIRCENLKAGAGAVSDSFEVFFVTPTRFIATKSGALYRFGKKL